MRRVLAFLFLLSLATLTSSPGAGRDLSAEPIAALEAWLGTPPDTRLPLPESPLADATLSKEEAEAAQALLWNDYAKGIRESREEEMNAGVMEIGERRMRFFAKGFGEKPANGHRLFLSMHGGGNAPPRVNDGQWENQKRLYEPEEGIYLVPRAPTDTWNLWHEAHIDGFFDRIIGNLVAMGEVDPDRVYLMGYSAGGDGVYQLAPRMADRLAAASMMAGHPNETSPLGLRNIGFALHVGAEDGGFNRNTIATEFGQKLDALQKADPEGYRHHLEIHPGRGHWMEREDRSAVPWMAAFARDPLPAKIVWKQDDVTHSRFYWLALPEGTAKSGQEIIVARDGQTISIERATDCPELVIRLNDTMLDLDQPVRIVAGEKVLFEGPIERRIVTMEKTLLERGDPRSVFPAEISVAIPGGTLD